MDSMNKTIDLFTINPDGADGRVDHFYADGHETPIEVVAVMDVYRWLQRKHGQLAAESFLRNVGSPR